MLGPYLLRLIYLQKVKFKGQDLKKKKKKKVSHDFNVQQCLRTAALGHLSISPPLQEAPDSYTSSILRFYMCLPGHWPCEATLYQ